MEIASFSGARYGEKNSSPRTEHLGKRLGLKAYVQGHCVIYSLVCHHLIQGTYSFADWLEVLRRVEYSNTNGNPDVGQTRTVSVQAQDNGGAMSNAAFVFITIQQYNDPPELSLGGPGIADFQTQFIEDGDCVPITSPDIQLVDVDSDRIQVVRVTLATTNVNPLTERITVLGDVADYPVNTFLIPPYRIFMVLTAPSPENYEAGLSRIVYCNTQDEPAGGDRRVTFEATDQGVPGTSLPQASSQTTTTTIEIVQVNDRPVLQIEQLNNVSIRGVPTPIIDPDSISLDDSDDMFFNELFIYITNDQDGRVNEIIEFARELPVETTSIGPILTANGEILYNVTFRGVGANRERVLETISAIRYNNRATNITVDPPRVICVQVQDFKIFSQRVCVNVTISAPNDFDPRFVNDSASLLFSFQETPMTVSVVRLVATDNDLGLAGEISYDIVQVSSTPFSGSARDTTSQGVFTVNSGTGQLDAPMGLDAEEFVLHVVTVEASDMGNPSRSATVQVQVTVLDVNDVAPMFIGTPYVASPQREEQTPPRTIFTVQAIDVDISPANNRIARYSLLNFNNLFSINPSSGQIQSVSLLDADVQSEYLLNISAEDSGSPLQITYVTVSFTLLDFNDNAGEVDQLTQAIYVVQENPVPQSIGPAIRIVDQDLTAPSITQLTIILTPNPADGSRTYDQCLGRCQDVRLTEAGLIPGAVDIFTAATFQSDNNVPGAVVTTTLGTGSCPAVHLVRGNTILDDGFGRITRSDLPANFGEGDFSFSFVATVRREGFAFLVPNTADPSATTVERDLALWIRRRRIDFYYRYGAARTRHSVSYSLQATDPIEGGVFFTWPTGPFVTRHFSLVVRSSVSPPVAEFYVDCQRLATLTLNGAVQRPTDFIDMFIAHSVPHPVSSGRLDAIFSGYYYHPTALTSTQLLSFCSCGFEALHLPTTLPPSIQATTETNLQITLAPTGSLIPEDDAVTVLREITYENTFFPPTFEPDRQLEFRLGEVDITGTSFGFIKLVSSDNELPVIDLNGVGTIPQAGINFQTEFTEDAGAVAIVSSSVRLDRVIEDFVTPTFELITVELLNPVDVNETLSASSSSPYITVGISSDGHRVDIVGPGIPADFIPVIQTLSYENTNDRPTTSFVRNISFFVVDTEGRTNLPLANTSVSLTAVNDAPEVYLTSMNGDLDGNVEFVEGSAGVVVAPDVAVRDVDNDNLAGATVTLVSPNLPTDALTFTTQPGITGSYDPNSGILTFTGDAPLSSYRDTLRTVQFLSTDSPFLDNSGDPESNPDRSIQILVTDGLLDSPSARVSVQFSPLDNPPEISLGATTLFFTDGDGPLAIAPDANITDADNRRLASMNVELNSGVDNNVLSDGVRTSRALFFSEDLLANFVTILRRITYINTADEPTLLNRTISVSVCDFREDTAGCPVVVLTIVVQDRNDNPPVFDNAEYTFNIVENSPIGTTVQSLHVDDVDRGLQPVSFTFSLTSSEPVPFTLETTSDSSVVILVTTGLLDFESVPAYNFTVTASDGLNTGTTDVSVLITNTNEPPSIVLSPLNPAVVGSQVVDTVLVQATVNITDPDLNDMVVSAELTVTNIPTGSNESLSWTPISGYTFAQRSLNVFVLENNGSSVPVSEALATILYVAGQPVIQPAEIRTVVIVVFDEGDEVSNQANISVSLASSPMFSTNTSDGVYDVSLPEGVVEEDFLQVSASVESGGTVITYAIEPGVGVSIDPLSGSLSLDRMLDREVEPLIEFEVYAIDDLPPARTGTSTVRITVLDQNDVAPMVGGLNNLTIYTGVPANLFPSVTITDPDSVGFIEYAIITVVGETPLVTSPFTGRACVDEHNVISKMSMVCGLTSFIDLLANNGSSSGATLTEDPFNNRVLYNTYQAGYTRVDTDFSAFEGLITNFTFALWIQPEQSGYVVYYGSPNGTERYFALFYDADANQLIVTMKRAGLYGLEAQVRVNFQLSTFLADGSYHFVMLQYSARTLLCVVDGVPMLSVAVVYKEQAFIGDVFGEPCLILTSR